MVDYRGQPHDHLRLELEGLFSAVCEVTTDVIGIDGKWYDADEEDNGITVMKQRVELHGSEIKDALRLHELVLGHFRAIETLCKGAKHEELADRLPCLLGDYQAYLLAIDPMAYCGGIREAADEFWRYPASNGPSKYWQDGEKTALFLQRMYDRTRHAGAIALVRFELLNHATHDQADEQLMRVKQELHTRFGLDLGLPMPVGTREDDAHSGGLDDIPF